MIELWSPLQIAEVISSEVAFEMNKEALAIKSQNVSADVCINGWRLLEFNFMPAESVTCVWDNGSLTVRVHADQSGTKITQVFRKSKMVEVVSYVEAKDL